MVDWDYICGAPSDYENGDNEVQASASMQVGISPEIVQEVRIKYSVIVVEKGHYRLVKGDK